MLYFYDYDVEKFPEDATEIIDVRKWDYWTITPGMDIQLYVHENHITNWKVISNNPEKYTTLISKNRFVKI